MEKGRGCYVVYCMPYDTKAERSEVPCGAVAPPVLDGAAPPSTSSITCSTGFGFPSSPTRHGWMIPFL